MKKIIAIAILIIIVVSSTACSTFSHDGDGSILSKKKEPLNATNFSQMADEEGNIYGILFWEHLAIQNVDSNHLHLSRVNYSDDTIVIQQEDPIDYTDNLFEYSTMGEKILILKKNVVREYTFQLQYADPDQQYLIFLGDDGINVLMTKKVSINTFKINANEFITEEDNLQQWIEYLDSCKSGNGSISKPTETNTFGNSVVSSSTTTSTVSSEIVEQNNTNKEIETKENITETIITDTTYVYAVCDDTPDHAGIVLRSEGTYYSEKLGVLPEGTMLYVLNEKNDEYIKVQTLTNQIGWVLERYLTKVN